MTLLDAALQPPAAPLETDICVVGAGAAGITVATELARQGREVCLVESGGLDLEADTQALHDLRSVGYPVRENFMSRVRQFGGSCNLWAGRSMRLVQDDLAPAGDPHGEGWLVSHRELSSYYPRAAAILDLPRIDMFEIDSFARSMTEHERRLFQSGPLSPTISLWARGPKRFGGSYRRELGRSPRVRVVLHANATRLRVAPESGQVQALELATLGGARFEVRARRYVLACGGLENARLLLVSGIGAEHGVVGRYFMDHPRSVFGRVRLAPGVKLPLLRGKPLADGRVQVGMGLSPEVRRRQGLLNHYATLESEVSGYTAAGYQSFVRTMKVVLRKGHAGSRWEVGRSKLGDIPGMIYLLTPKELMPHPVYRLYWSLRNALHPRPDGASRVVVYFCEQPPDAESRVTLTDELDPLGMPRLALNWRIGPEVTRSVLALQEIIRERLRETGVGELDAPDDEPRYTDASHHMGTTRMSASPQTGVVDGQCRVHGHDNLFMAGSSVFPSAGHANPTLTIVALGIRLAEHLGSTQP
jgi:choline dehydrogenase-like flavoprotein